MMLLSILYRYLDRLQRKDLMLQTTSLQSTTLISKTNMVTVSGINLT